MTYARIHTRARTHSHTTFPLADCPRPHPPPGFRRAVCARRSHSRRGAVRKALATAAKSTCTRKCQRNENNQNTDSATDTHTPTPILTLNHQTHTPPRFVAEVTGHPWVVLTRQCWHRCRHRHPRHRPHRIGNKISPASCHCVWCHYLIQSLRYSLRLLFEQASPGHAPPGHVVRFCYVLWV